MVQLPAKLYSTIALQAYLSPCAPYPALNTEDFYLLLMSTRVGASRRLHFSLRGMFLELNELVFENDVLEAAGYDDAAVEAGVQLIEEIRVINSGEATVVFASVEVAVRVMRRFGNLSNDRCRNVTDINKTLPRNTTETQHVDGIVKASSAGTTTGAAQQKQHQYQRTVTKGEEQLKLDTTQQEQEAELEFWNSRLDPSTRPSTAAGIEISNTLHNEEDHDPPDSPAWETITSKSKSKSKLKVEHEATTTKTTTTQAPPVSNRALKRAAAAERKRRHQLELQIHYRIRNNSNTTEKVHGFTVGGPGNRGVVVAGKSWKGGRYEGVEIKFVRDWCEQGRRV